MTTGYVALLRGINVGSRNRIAMADLRSLLEGLGHTEVRTHLQSGNALFAAAKADPAALGAEISEAIAGHLGLTVPCVVLSDEDLARVVAANPLADVATDPAKFVVTFLSRPPVTLGDLDPAKYAPEVFAVGEREVYVWCPDGVRNVKLSHAFFEKREKDGMVATARNWNTVTALLDLIS
jgi:uncharacterized protein (DUF1697 family)